MGTNDENKWYFPAEVLENSPSRKHGIDSMRELSYRQQGANFIQDMGQKLQLSQLCINTAIIYFQRFYVFHSFYELHRNKLAIAALFLAAKVEEQPRKLEHLIKMAHACLHKDTPQLDIRSEDYTVKLNEAVAYENILLQTLGFDIGIEHPHTYVVKVCQLVKASKDLAQTSYIMATTSLHMTTMPLRYKPTIVACVCIHLACKWSSYLIEKCSAGRDWFYYVDKDVTPELLENLTQNFVEILEQSPHRFKRKFAKDVIPRPLESIPGPSGIISSNIASTSNNCRAIALPVDSKAGVAIKKERDPPQVPQNVEHSINVKEKKPVVIKKEPEAIKQEEEPQVLVPLPQPSLSFDHQTSHQAVQIPSEHFEGTSNESVEIKQEKLQPPPLPLHHPQPSPPPPVVHMPVEHSSNKRSNKEFTESSSSKRHKNKHASRSKSSSSSNNSTNHSEPTSSGIKVKIRKDQISLSGVDCNQKYTPQVKAESPKKPLRIKLPKPPPPPPVETPKPEKFSAPLKLVLTKDKSGSGSYSTSHRSEHRESRKRSHASAAADGSHRDHKTSIEPPVKYPKVEQYQKNHHSGEQRPNKMSRHSSSHRSDSDNTHNSASSSRLQYPAASENSTFQNYAVPNYQNSYLIPPPPLPKMKGHNMVGKTNSNFPMQPPLPPPQPPPPPPPPEDV